LWNGVLSNTPGSVAGFYCSAIGVQVTNVEAQDNYCDGFYLNQHDATWTGLNSNNNGRLSGDDTKSSRIGSNYKFGSNIVRGTFQGTSFNHEGSGIGSDGFYATEYPYSLNTSSLTQFASFQLSYDETKVNQPPANPRKTFVSNQLLDYSVYTFDNSETFVDMNPFSMTPASGTKTVRFFRTTEATGTSRIIVNSPGTASSQHIINANSDATFCRVAGSLGAGHETTGGLWNTGHLQLGPYHLWIDNTGRLRVKSTAPTSATDGTVVGTQV
jgi:hypothetical protein